MSSHGLDELQDLQEGDHIAVRYQIGRTKTYLWYVGQVIELSSVKEAGIREEGFYRRVWVKIEEKHGTVVDPLVLFSTGYKTEERGAWVYYYGDVLPSSPMTDEDIFVKRLHHGLDT